MGNTFNIFILQDEVVWPNTSGQQGGGTAGGPCDIVHEVERLDEYSERLYGIFDFEVNLGRVVDRDGVGSWKSIEKELEGDGSDPYFFVEAQSTLGDVYTEFIPRESGEGSSEEMQYSARHHLKSRNGLYSHILEHGIDAAGGADSNLGSRLHRVAGGAIVGARERYDDLNRTLVPIATD